MTWAVWPKTVARKRGVQPSFRRRGLTAAPALEGKNTIIMRLVVVWCVFTFRSILFLFARYETALIFSPKESLCCLGAARGGEAVVQGSLTNTVSLLIENKMVMIFLTMLF